VASFSAGAIAARLPVGTAADRWGWTRRSLLVTGATVLATSTALLVAAPSAPTVFALRALAGIADALFYTAAAATAYELAPAGRAGAAVSHFTVAAYLGLLAGRCSARRCGPCLAWGGSGQARAGRRAPLPCWQRCCRRSGDAPTVSGARPSPPASGGS